MRKYQKQRLNSECHKRILQVHFQKLIDDQTTAKANR